MRRLRRTPPKPIPFAAMSWVPASIAMQYNRLTLEVLSKTDMLVITGVTINRGNCSTLKDNYPMRLAFGKSHQFYIIPNACNILEAVVMTDRGPAEFGFE